MRTYKFRIYPSDAQIDMLNSTLELCRQFYNAMLQQRYMPASLEEGHPWQHNRQWYKAEGSN